jgi:hypothetical protein
MFVFLFKEKFVLIMSLFAYAWLDPLLAIRYAAGYLLSAALPAVSCWLLAIGCRLSAVRC